MLLEWRQYLHNAAGLESTQKLEQVLADVGDPPSSLEDRSLLTRQPHTHACLHITCCVTWLLAPGS